LDQAAFAIGGHLHGTLIVVKQGKDFNITETWSKAPLVTTSTLSLPPVCSKGTETAPRLNSLGNLA
jgi:hypothetical protein